MKKIKLFFTLLFFFPLSVFANQPAGKVFQDATGLIAQSTPNLKDQVLLKNTAQINASYENAPLIGRVLILISDTLKVSLDTLFAAFWVIGFGVFILSLVHLHDAQEDDAGRHQKRSKNKWAVSGLVLSTCLMAFNGVVMMWGDTFGVGTNVHSTYDFNYDKVDQSRQKIISNKDGAFEIDNTTGEVIFKNFYRP